MYWQGYSSVSLSGNRGYSVEKRKRNFHVWLWKGNIQRAEWWIQGGWKRRGRMEGKELRRKASMRPCMCWLCFWWKEMNEERKLPKLFWQRKKKHAVCIWTEWRLCSGGKSSDRAGLGEADGGEIEGEGRAQEQKKKKKKDFSVWEELTKKAATSSLKEEDTQPTWRETEIYTTTGVSLTCTVQKF